MDPCTAYVVLYVLGYVGGYAGAHVGKHLADLVRARRRDRASVATYQPPEKL